jgi:hypothetical protein
VIITGFPRASAGWPMSEMGSFSTEAAGSAARPTSASPRKLT